MSGRSLPAPVGGVEKEYLLLLPRRGEEEGRRWTSGHDLVCSRLARECEERGVDFQCGSWAGVWKAVCEDGGAWGFEDLSVFEVSTPESRDGLEAASHLRRYEDAVRRILADAWGGLEQGEQRCARHDILLTGTPAYMPRFEPRGSRHIWLGFHLNFFARLDRGQRLQLAAWLALLSPFLSAGGGLTEKGLVLSPAGCRAGNTLGFGMDRRPCLVELKFSPLVRENEVDSGFCRLHLPCFDAPFGGRGAALSFAAVQAVLGLLLLRECLPGLRLANPARVMAGISSASLLEPAQGARRFRLADGRMITHADALAAAAEGLQEARRMFRLDPLRELALERITAGIRAWPDDREALAEEFDAFRKAAVYRRTLELQGVSPAWFDRVAVPAVYLASRMGAGLSELAGSSPREARALARRGGSEHERDRLCSHLRKNRLSPGDLPGLASAVRRVRSIELRLGEVFPGPSPLRAREEASWEELARIAAPPQRTPGRAATRAELVRHFSALGLRVQASWDHLFFYSPQGGIGVIAMPDPASAGALPFRWMEDEEVSDFGDGLSLEADIIRCFEEARGEDGGDFQEKLGELLGAWRVRELSGEGPLAEQLSLF